MELHVSIAICTHNREKLLRRCVQSLLASARRLSCTWELLVVDNASTDRTADMLANEFPIVQLRCVREDSLGISPARNRAVTEARGDVLIYVDDDVVVPDDYLPIMLDEFEKGRWDVMGGAILPDWQSSPPSWLGEDLFSVLGLLPGEQTVREGLPRVFTASAVFRRQLLVERGPQPFPISLGRSGNSLIGNEESYLVEQLAVSGAKIGFCEKAPVRHHVPAERMTLCHYMRYKVAAGASQARELLLRNGKAELPFWVWGDMIRRGIGIAQLLLFWRRSAGVRSLLGFCHRLGRIVEYCKLRRRGAHPAPGRVL